MSKSLHPIGKARVNIIAVLSWLAILALGAPAISGVMESFRRWLEHQHNPLLKFYAEYMWAPPLILMILVVVVWGTYRVYANEKRKCREEIANLRRDVATSEAIMREELRDLRAYKAAKEAEEKSV